MPVFFARGGLLLQEYPRNLKLLLLFSEFAGCCVRCLLFWRGARWSSGGLVIFWFHLVSLLGVLWGGGWACLCCLRSVFWGTKRKMLECWAAEGCGNSLAHRNRSDFCDLQLRCPSQIQKLRAITRRKAVVHCDFRVRRTIASDLRFRAAISRPGTHSFCGNAGDLAPSTRKSLAIAIVPFCCAKGNSSIGELFGGRCPSPSTWRPPVNRSCAFQCLGLVFATLAPCVCDIVWSSGLVRSLSGGFVLAIMSVYLSGLSDRTNPLGSLVRTCNLCC